MNNLLKKRLGTSPKLKNKIKTKMPNKMLQTPKKIIHLKLTKIHNILMLPAKLIR